MLDRDFCKIFYINDIKLYTNSLYFCCSVFYRAIFYLAPMLQELTLHRVIVRAILQALVGTTGVSLVAYLMMSMV